MIYAPDVIAEELYDVSMPLIYSRAKESEGEVLNADGYSCY